MWAISPPEFGERSVLDRLGQLEPTVLLAVSGYRYGDKLIDRHAQVAAIRAGLPSLRAVVDVPYVRRGASRRGPVGRPRRRAGAARVRPGAVRTPVVRPLLVRHDRPAEADRPRARRHPRRASEEPRAQLGSRAGRPPVLVHDDRVDDVERARLDAAPARVDRDDRRQPGVPRPLLPVAARRGDARDVLRPQPRVHDGLPEGLARPGPALRPLLGPHRLRGRLAVADGGVRVALRAVRQRAVPQRRQRRHRRVHRHGAGLPAAPRLRGGDVRALPRRRRGGVRPRRPPGRRRARRARHPAADAVDARGLLERHGRLPLPRRVLRALPGRVAPRRLDPLHRARQLGHHRTLGRDAQPRRRAPGHERASTASSRSSTRCSTASSSTCEASDELLLFVVLRDGVELDDGLRTRISDALRNGLSPRHRPDDDRRRRRPSRGR